MKIVSLVVTILFLCNATLYSFPGSKNSLRLSVGEEATYNRIIEVMETGGEQEGRIDPNIQTVRDEGNSRATGRDKTVLDKLIANIPGDKKTITISFMCTGNKNRSVVMEAATKYFLEKAGVSNIKVTSFGESGSWIGNKELARAASEKGLDTKSIHSKEVTKDMVDGADFIITATYQHRKYLIKKFATRLGDRIKKLLRIESGKALERKVMVFGDLFTQELTDAERREIMQELQRNLPELEFKGIGFSDLNRYLPDPKKEEISIEGMLLLISRIVERGLVPKLVQLSKRMPLVTASSRLSEVRANPAQSTPLAYTINLYLIYLEEERDEIWFHRTVKLLKAVMDKDFTVLKRRGQMRYEEILSTLGRLDELGIADLSKENLTLIVTSAGIQDSYGEIVQKLVALMDKYAASSPDILKVIPGFARHPKVEILHGGHPVSELGGLYMLEVKVDGVEYEISSEDLKRVEGMEPTIVANPSERKKVAEAVDRAHPELHLGEIALIENWHWWTPKLNKKDVRTAL
ncbi:MAG: hypothetical protein Q7O04_04480 [Candidatus Omnitrophota bacterium]|nr:hypothetical protein [Candidatus Omnitrophota bacterium]